jgi:hypothetical protein
VLNVNEYESRRTTESALLDGTKAVGIVVSESSVMRLFCHGHLVGEIIPEIWIMDHAHLRGTVKRQQVGELTILTPSQRPTPISKSA